MFTIGVRLAHPIFKFPGTRGPPPEDGAASVISRIDSGIRRVQRFSVKSLGVDPCDLPQLPDAGRAAMAGNFQTHAWPQCALELIEIFDHAAPSFLLRWLSEAYRPKFSSRMMLWIVSSSSHFVERTARSGPSPT